MPCDGSAPFDPSYLTYNQKTKVNFMVTVQPTAENAEIAKAER